MAQLPLSAGKLTLSLDQRAQVLDRVTKGRFFAVPRQSPLFDVLWAKVVELRAQGFRDVVLTPDALGDMTVSVEDRS